MGNDIGEFNNEKHPTRKIKKAEENAFFIFKSYN